MLKFILSLYLVLGATTAASSAELVTIKAKKRLGYVTLSSDEAKTLKVGSTVTFTAPDGRQWQGEVLRVNEWFHRHMAKISLPSGMITDRKQLKVTL